MKTLGVILILIALSGLVILSFTWIIKSADKFYEKAREVEEMIKRGDDKKTVFDALVKLEEKSFHRNTSARIRELAKMFEIKYGVDILKS